MVASIYEPPPLPSPSTTFLVPIVDDNGVFVEFFIRNDDDDDDFHQSSSKCNVMYVYVLLGK